VTRPTRRQLVVAALLVAVSWVLGDLWGAFVAASALGAVHVGVPPRRLPLVGVGLMACAALGWLVGNASRWGSVSFDLVSRNPWPGSFGLAAVVLLLVGVALDLGPEPRDKDIDERT